MRGETWRFGQAHRRKMRQTTFIHGSLVWGPARLKASGSRVRVGWGTLVNCLDNGKKGRRKKVLRLGCQIIRSRSTKVWDNTSPTGSATRPSQYSQTRVVGRTWKSAPGTERPSWAWRYLQASPQGLVPVLQAEGQPGGPSIHTVFVKRTRLLQLAPPRASPFLVHPTSSRSSPRTATGPGPITAGGQVHPRPVTGRQLVSLVGHAVGVEWMVNGTFPGPEGSRTKQFFLAGSQTGSRCFINKRLFWVARAPPCLSAWLCSLASAG